MKNEKIYVPLLMILIFAAAWYMPIQKKNSKDNEYNNYVTTARKLGDKKIVVDAVDNYNKALEVKDTMDLRFEIADFYNNMKMYSQQSDVLEQVLNKYPDKAESYERLSEYYRDRDDYEKCFQILNTAKKRNITTKKLTEINNSITYKYMIGFDSFSDCGSFANSRAAVLDEKNNWGYVNSKGSVVVGFKYSYATPFSKNGDDIVTAGVVEKGEAFLIDNEGNRKYVPDEKYDELGMISGNRVLAKKDGKYLYLNENLQKQFGEYEDATAFNMNVAAVKTKGAWSLIDETGKTLSSTTFQDVKIDGKRIAFRNNVCFVKEDGKYVLVDKNGNKIGEKLYDDCVPFLQNDTNGSTEYAAVKVGDKWGFIDSKGNEKIPPTYTNASSFSDGVAAVEVGGKWGYIDKDNNIVIDCVFDGAKDFSTDGITFVKKGDKWVTIKFYKNDIGA